jgi:hypothetical protein
MARPLKEGFDYFPFDINLDVQFQAIVSLFGNDGFAWVVNFWREAYKNNQGTVNLNGILGVLNAKNSLITVEKQNEIIKAGIELGLFYEKEPGLYTSNGIQKRIDKIREGREYGRNYAKIELLDSKPPNNDQRTPQIKEKEKEKDINTCPLFIEFWKLYPRKEGKGDAVKAWKKIKTPSETLCLIKTALEWQIKTTQWTEKNGKYIPHPTTYLNANKWLDEPIKIKTGGLTW